MTRPSNGRRASDRTSCHSQVGVESDGTAVGGPFDADDVRTGSQSPAVTAAQPDKNLSPGQCEEVATVARGPSGDISLPTSPPWSRKLGPPGHESLREPMKHVARILRGYEPSLREESQPSLLP